MKTDERKLNYNFAGIQSRTVCPAACRVLAFRESAETRSVAGHQVGGHIRNGLSTSKFQSRVKLRPTFNQYSGDDSWVVEPLFNRSSCLGYHQMLAPSSYPFQVPHSLITWDIPMSRSQLLPHSGSTQVDDWLAAPGNSMSRLKKTSVLWKEDAREQKKDFLEHFLLDWVGGILISFIGDNNYHHPTNINHPSDGKIPMILMEWMVRILSLDSSSCFCPLISSCFLILVPFQLMIDLFQLQCGGNRKINKLDNVWQLNRVVLLFFLLQTFLLSHPPTHDDYVAQIHPDVTNRTAALLQMPVGRYQYLRKLLPALANQSEDCLTLNIYVPGSGKCWIGPQSRGWLLLIDLYVIPRHLYGLICWQQIERRSKNKDNCDHYKPKTGWGVWY